MQKHIFVIKNVLTLFKTIKRILVSQFYYKVGKNKDYNFFQSVWDAAILHIVFLYSWADRKKWLPYIFCCGNEENDDVWEK